MSRNLRFRIGELMQQLTLFDLDREVKNYHGATPIVGSFFELCAKQMFDGILLAVPSHQIEDDEDYDPWLSRCPDLVDRRGKIFYEVKGTLWRNYFKVHLRQLRGYCRLFTHDDYEPPVESFRSANIAKNLPKRAFAQYVFFMYGGSEFVPFPTTQSEIIEWIADKIRFCVIVDVSIVAAFWASGFAHTRTNYTSWNPLVQIRRAYLMSLAGMEIPKASNCPDREELFDKIGLNLKDYEVDHWEQNSISIQDVPVCKFPVTRLAAKRWSSEPWDRIKNLQYLKDGEHGDDEQASEEPEDFVPF